MSEPNLTSQILYGTKAIATFLGVRPRQALHMAEQGHIPTFHIGRVICANPQTIRNHVAGLEAGARAAVAAE